MNNGSKLYSVNPIFQQSASMLPKQSGVAEAIKAANDISCQCAQILDRIRKIIVGAVVALVFKKLILHLGLNLPYGNIEFMNYYLNTVAET